MIPLSALSRLGGLFMKLKSLLWMFGLKPKPQVYGTESLRFQLSQDGEIAFEKWQHPKDYFHPFDQLLVDQLRRWIAPGDTVLDIGAHCGDFTVPLALAAGPSGIVFAWEPNPYVYRVLEKNSRLNLTKTNIVPVEAAAARNNGYLEFQYSDPGFCNGGCFDGISRWKHGHPYRLTVPARRITDWMTQRYPERLSRVRFIKIDAEGYDFEVLKSIEAILYQQHPFLHVEMYRYLPEARRVELWQFLHQLGYDLHRTEGGYGVEPGEAIAKSDVMKWEHYDFLALPSHRFIERAAA